jgi:hypothetical protein
MREKEKNPPNFVSTGVYSPPKIRKKIRPPIPLAKKGRGDEHRTT